MITLPRIVWGCAVAIGACNDRGGGAPSETDAGADGAHDVVTTGPLVHIHVRAVTSPVDHAPGSSGQTLSEYVTGYRSLTLLRSMSDAEPLLVFDYGQDFVEASHGDGDDTVVASVRAAELENGEFTIGRVVMSHVRYTVDSVLHYEGSAIPGQFQNTIVLSDDTMLHDMVRNRGWYRTAFRATGLDFPREGTDFPIPVLSSGGISVVVENAEQVHVFPLALTVVSTITADEHIVMELNTHEAFRWTDQDMPNFEDGVFDVTLVGYEPVVQFGPNSFRVFTQP